MNKTIMHIGPWLAAAAVGGTLFLAPVASAATTTQPIPDNNSAACSSPASGQVFGQEGGCSAPNGSNSSDSNLPYDDAGNTYEHAGAV